MDKKDYLYLMEKASFFANILRKVFDTEWVEEVIAGVGISHVHIHLYQENMIIDWTRFQQNH